MNDEAAAPSTPPAGDEMGLLVNQRVLILLRTPRPIVAPTATRGSDTVDAAHRPRSRRVICPRTQ